MALLNFCALTLHILRVGTVIWLKRPTTTLLITCLLMQVLLFVALVACNMWVAGKAEQVVQHSAAAGWVESEESVNWLEDGVLLPISGHQIRARVLAAMQAVMTGQKVVINLCIAEFIAGICSLL